MTGLFVGGPMHNEVHPVPASDHAVFGSPVSDSEGYYSRQRWAMVGWTITVWVWSGLSEQERDRLLVEVLIADRARELGRWLTDQDGPNG